jgi:hypothetical protein
MGQDWSALACIWGGGVNCTDRLTVDIEFCVEIQENLSRDR